MEKDLYFFSKLSLAGENDRCVDAALKNVQIQSSTCDLYESAI